MSIIAIPHKASIRFYTRNGRRKRQNGWKGRAKRGNRKESEVALGQSWSSGEIIFAFVIAGHDHRKWTRPKMERSSALLLSQQSNLDCSGRQSCLLSLMRRFEQVAKTALISTSFRPYFRAWLFLVPLLTHNIVPMRSCQAFLEEQHTKQDACWRQGYVVPHFLVLHPPVSKMLLTRLLFISRGLRDSRA